VERVHEIPDLGRAAKGRSIANVLELQAGERIAAMKRIEGKYDENKEDITLRQENLFVLFATRNGTVKKTALSDFANVRKGGIIAINILEGDDLIDVKLTEDGDEVVLITGNGLSIRFDAAQARAMGRNTTGVRGINLKGDDQVVSLAIVEENHTLLVAGENGLGKRTPFEEYRTQTRGGKGIITMKTTEKTGRIVGALSVCDEDEMMLMTSKGLMVRIAVSDVRETGRNAQGVKLVELSGGDKLQAIAPVISEEKDGEEVEGEADPSELETDASED
jgi:DNA gyrase subunit A